MAITLNGTTGITSPAETVQGNLSYTGTLTGGTGVVNIGSGQVYKDASGNVGIGVTPSAWNSLYKAAQFGAGASISGRTDSGSWTEIQSNSYRATDGAWKYLTTAAASRQLQEAGAHYWYVAPSGTAGNAITFTNPMTVNSGGISLRGAAGADSGGVFFARGDNATNAWAIQTNDTNFYITRSGFTSFAYLNSPPTAWVFASDRRIKKDIVALDYGLASVMAMQPKRYTLIDSNVAGIGFIAQELREVIPEAVHGEEAEFLDTDTPQQRALKTLAIGKEILIPILVKAIQEQQALITTLTARITALENK